MSVRILFALLFFPAFLVAAPFSADISLSANKIQVDENLTISATLRYPETHEPDLDSLRMNILKYAGLTEPPFALVNEEVEELQGGKKVVYTLEPLLDGIHFLSLYNIKFLPKNPEANQPETLIADIFEVETTLPPEKESYFGVTYPLLSLTNRFPITISQDNRVAFLDNPEEERNEKIVRERAFPWPELMGVLLFGVVLLIARMQPPRKKDTEKELKKLALSARKKATASLAAIQAESPPHGQYYNRLTDTIRRYIEEKYRVEATTKTTPEFLEAMGSHPAFDEKIRSLLSDFLISSDKVKFASYSPSQSERDQAHKTALRFIEYERL